MVAANISTWAYRRELNSCATILTTECSEHSRTRVERQVHVAENWVYSALDDYTSNLICHALVESCYLSLDLSYISLNFIKSVFVVSAILLECPLESAESRIGEACALQCVDSVGGEALSGNEVVIYFLFEFVKICTEFVDLIPQWLEVNR